MKNRITAAIARLKARIPERIASGLTTQADVDKLHGTLDMDLEEYVKFQELKSLASQNGDLTSDEAQTVYGYLGETLETFNNQPVEVKSVLIQLFKELLGRQISRVQAAS